MLPLVLSAALTESAAVHVILTARNHPLRVSSPKTEPSVEPEARPDPLILVYWEERTLFEESIEDRDIVSIELDVLEAYTIHSEEEPSKQILAAMISVLTAVNCATGLNDKFPLELVPFVIVHAMEQLEIAIEYATPSREFWKVARRSLYELKDIIIEHVENEMGIKVILQPFCG